MKYILVTILLFAKSFSAQKPPEGFFTTEASAVVLNDNVIVSIKKYNPTPDEIKQAKIPRKGEPLNYLQAPAMSVNIEMVNKDFESKLYSLDKNGNIAWEKSLGWSNKSLPSPLTEGDGFIYTGESMKEEDKVIIRKLDSKGKQLWEASFDSLHNVNAILVENNKLNLLVSFDKARHVTTDDGMESFPTYSIYFFVQLDPATGKLIKKEYQAMGNYLSSKGFSHPIISTDYAYYLHNRDSAAFLSVENQQSAIIVTKDMSKDNQILALTAGPESYHYLTVSDKGKPVLSMHSDMYVKTKKFTSILPVTPLITDRFFLSRIGDTVITIIQHAKKASVIYTREENSKVLHEVAVSNPIAATVVTDKMVYLVKVEGRDVPGRSGKIVVSNFIF